MELPTDSFLGCKITLKTKKQLNRWRILCQGIGPVQRRFEAKTTAFVQKDSVLPHDKVPIRKKVYNLIPIWIE